jgi:hypothetical protein
VDPSTLLTPLIFTAFSAAGVGAIQQIESVWEALAIERSAPLDMSNFTSPLAYNVNSSLMPHLDPCIMGDGADLADAAYAEYPTSPGLPLGQPNVGVTGFEADDPERPETTCPATEVAIPMAIGVDPHSASLQDDTLSVWIGSSADRAQSLYDILSFVDDLDDASLCLHDMAGPSESVSIPSSALEEWRTQQGIQPAGRDLQSIQALLTRSLPCRSYFLRTVGNHSLAQADNILRFSSGMSYRMLVMNSELSERYLSDGGHDGSHKSNVATVMRASAFREGVRAKRNRTRILTDLLERDFKVNDPRMADMYRSIHPDDQVDSWDSYFDPAIPADRNARGQAKTRYDKEIQATGVCCLINDLMDRDDIPSVCDADCAGPCGAHPLSSRHSYRTRIS